MNADKPNYRIFRVEEDKSHFPKKVSMQKIYAENDADAYSKLNEFRKLADSEYTYYVEPWCPHIVIRDGEKHAYESCFDMFDYKKHSLAAIFDNVGWWFRKCFVYFPKDAWYWVRNTLYLLKHKQQYSSVWRIDDTLLDTLLFNIRILKNNKHTLSWKMLYKAYAEEHPELSHAEVMERVHGSYSGFEEKIEKRAIELEQQMFSELCENIIEYKYYLGDYSDVKLLGEKHVSAELLETDKRLRSTLPLIKGSYDRYDYKVLNAMVNKRWNRIWEIVREYGQEFND